MRKFVSELRRRNVLRVAAAYALSAWILIEAGSVLLPTFGASEGFFQVYVVAVIAGFIVSVVVAWVFQWTPEGVKLDRDVDRTATEDRGTRQRMNYAIIALLVIALVVSVTFNVTNTESGEGEAPVASIAVLPFASRSANPDNRLFADGIHDDLLTRLANVKALKVISRTSVMEYRETTKNVREIGEELGVESVLAGTVQHIGDSVRINLELIDARSDEHIWAKSYDHQLTMENIFSVQSEISESVADALQATLSPDERVRMAAVPTSDLRAYRLYKEGKDNLYQRQLGTIRAARRQFEEAIVLDPKYAEAHAGLAESLMLLSINHQDIPEREAMKLAQASLDRALELDPDLADAYAILGLMKATIWGWSRLGSENIEAETAYQKAIELNPNHATAYMWFASLRDNEDRTDEAIELYQKAMELDPLARIPYSNLPMVYAKRGEHAAAISLWREATRIHPEWPTIYQYMAVHLWGLGRLDESYAWYAKAVELGADKNFSGGTDIGVLIDLGDYGRARDKLEGIPESVPYHAFGQGLLAMMEGEYGKATDLFVDIIEGSLLPARFVYDVASNSALLAGDLETAKKYVLAADPILSGDTSAKVDRSATGSAVKLAYIHQREGRDEQAATLLTETLDVLRTAPRLGTYGFGIRDVQAYALLGRREDAIAAFREALDDGYRGSILFDGWPLAIDPFLDTIREDPRFVAMLAELDGYLKIARDSLFEAHAAGGLDSLRAKAGRT